MELRLIYTTFSTQKQAKEMAQILLNKNLVACVNMYAPMTSMYQWKGKVEEESEVPVIFKTTGKKIKQAVMVIEKNHPYETPCITIIKPEDTNTPFLNWVDASVSN